MRIAWLCGVSVAIFLAGCGGSGSSPATPPPGTPTVGPVTLTPATLNWTLGGTVQDVTLTNQGTTALTITSIEEGGGVAPYTGEFAIAANNCGTSLAAQSSCTISVASNFASGNTQGQPISATGTITVTDNATAGPQVATLNSTNIAMFYITNGTVPFAAQPEGMKATSSTYNYLAFNAYSVAPPLSLQMSGANSGDFSYSISLQGGPIQPCSPTTPIDFGGYDACMFTFGFTPSAIGARTAKLMINGGNQYILLTGTGN